MPQKLDVAIIGGGPGGLSAGIYAKRAMLKTVLFEKAMLGGQVAISTEIENYLGYQRISGAELSAHFISHAQHAELDIVMEEVVSLQVEKNNHTIKLLNGSEIKASTVILAMGGKPKPLNIPGEKENYGRGVSYCAVCDGFFFRNKTIVVVGGGNTAVEDAIYLAGLAEKVYLVHRRDELRAEKILAEQAIANPKIEIIWRTVVTEVLSDSTGVTGVMLKNAETGATKSLATDGLFIFAGFEPNIDILPKEITLNKDGYVQTDEYCQTSVAGIFAIGDVRRGHHRQIIIATGDGAIAALSANYYLTNCCTIKE